MGIKKGNHFGTLYGGPRYDFFADMLGFDHRFYEKAAAELPLQRGMKLLDLGCGTASLTLAIARKLGHEGEFHGLDLSPKQLSYALTKTKKRPEFSFYRATMDILPFKDNTFDMITTSVAFCETSADVRRGAIHEASRVLKKNGLFVLIDCGKPRMGMSSFILLPFFMLKENHDSWNNTYVQLCRDCNLEFVSDAYLKSYIQCQIFRKTE
ncbi:demethylmenaquinone methyltransferase/2-methoxy-6-polyprenyl-1,4-benzoquinol methylase [Methanohalophilus levihalophilus]|uniref:class I SAM-dependent methyltransferase n=1 Tax=Methanohalophilus levihalophilus TaxID=1431282 RepID=UPI001AE4FE83|nr:class I SAM-dependent methyltransferase [Methanohalophilus levihalophilus]MBP2030950.1 demethylmenaquinone methyltransferase/2-methoxy-6-polyprenyl-1,4-benzoquinol methylase [Methanohalophilus levihalophilus]